MRNFYCLLFITLFSTILHAQDNPPNIVLIQVDDMGFDDLSCNGNTLSHTPSIDALALESVQFGNYMVASVCSPTRASLLTGRDFWKTGVSGMHGGNDFMHLDETTVAEILKENGYATGMWGKWHSGKSDGYYPWDKGFDEGFYAKLYKHYPSSGIFNGEEVTNNGKWSDEQIVDYAIDFISRNNDKPFFAYVSSQTCHGSWASPDLYKQKYEGLGLSDDYITLLGMLEYLDVQINRLLQYLEDNGLSDNTIVIFMSDNGPIPQGESDAEWNLRNNHHFLGNKARNWQNGLKSPLYIRWPGHYTPNKVNRLVSITDIFPTLLDIAGVALPENNLPIDGRSIKTYLEGDTVSLSEKTAFFVHWSPERADQQFAPILTENIPDINVAIQSMTMITEEYKFLYNPVDVTGSPAKYNDDVLIDLRTDPMESINVAQSNLSIVESMTQDIENWFSSILSSDHPFSRPVFQIGTKGKMISDVLAFGPSKTAGVSNDSHSVIGFDAVGDRIEYNIYVHQPGTYEVKMSSKNNGLTGMRVKATCGKEELKTRLGEGYTQNVGQFFLGAGEGTFSFEIIELNGTQSPFLEELKLFEFELIDSISGLSDKNVTRETAYLFNSLKSIGSSGLIFGQHHATYEGQSWTDNTISTDFMSDCITSVGDHPGLFGFDFGRGISKFKTQVEEIFRRGGLVTYSWHAKNPVTGGSVNDLSGNVVASILEGGEHWDTWRSELDQVADFFNSLEVDGVNVPIIFRPFHEQTGSWFWWGTGNCSDQQYIDLWRLTVDYLRIDREVDNILLAYSPSKPSINQALSLSMYPGDKYVDILGFDSYGENVDLKDYVIDGARFMSQWAKETNKVCAITEAGIRSGIQNSTNDDWFMSDFLNLLKNDIEASEVAFFLTWRNSASDSYCVPLPGQPTYNSFVNFYNDPTTLFLHDLGDIYGNPFGAPKYNVKVVVKAQLSDELLSACEVRINNTILLTDGNGEVQFSDIPEEFLLSVKKDDYTSYGQATRIIFSDTVLDIKLLQSEKEVTFHLTDASTIEPILGVNLLLNGETKVSDSEGMINYSVQAGTYDYVIEKDSYQKESGTLEIISDTTITLSLIRTHASIKFKLKEGTKPINKAFVSIGSDSIETNNLGIAKFDGMPIESDYKYAIRRDGYDLVSDNLYLSADTTVNIEMVVSDTTSIHRYNGESVRIWPNPARDQLFLEIPNELDECIARIIDLQGNIVSEQHMERSSFSIPLEDFQSGLYLLQLFGNNFYEYHCFVKH